MTVQFFMGLWLGATAGALFMALFQVNKNRSPCSPCSPSVKEQAETAIAEAAIAEYNEAYRTGGELPYPQWAADYLKQKENKQESE